MDDTGSTLHRPQAESEKGEDFRLLFVCTGNTCRSPLAEVLARRALHDRGWTHVEVRSAGVASVPGTPASDGSLRVAREGGLDLTAHQATPLSPTLLEWADLILTMAPEHLHPIREAGAGDRAAVITHFARDAEGDLGDSGVADPVGRDLADYRSTYRQLEELVARLMDYLEPLLDP